MPPRDHQPAELIDLGLSALAQGRPGELAELVREVWRETRDVGIASSYELLVRELQAAPLPGRDAAERAAAWRERAIERAGDPLELPVLLGTPWSPELDELERLRLLEPWSPDPLLAAALARRLRIPAVPPTILGAAEIRRRTVTLLAAQGDLRQLSTLEWMRAEPLPTDTRSEVRRAQARLANVRPSTRQRPQQRAEAIARLARRAAPRRAFEARSAELLAAVHADPDADEPRLVYADWLSAHGDPRGELIGLQLARARDGTPASERERELLDRHADAWADELHAVLGTSGRVFARGFLESASVEVPGLDGEVVDLPEWATLRVLDGHVSDALARRGQLDHLRELYGFLSLERFVALRADNRLARVESYECSLADPNLPLDTPLGLRSLLVRRALDDALIALTESRAIAGLEQLGVYYGSAPADHRERGSAVHRIELLRERLPAHVRRLCLVDEQTVRASRPRGWLVTLERDELGLFSRLRVDWLEPTSTTERGRSAFFQLRDVLGPLLDSWVRTLVQGRVPDDQRRLIEHLLRDLAESWSCELLVAE